MAGNTKKKTAAKTYTSESLMMRSIAGVVLLALGITATSIVDAILVGLLLFSAALTVTGAACFVRCLLDCGNE